MYEEVGGEGEDFAFPGDGAEGVVGGLDEVQARLGGIGA